MYSWGEQDWKNYVHLFAVKWERKGDLGRERRVNEGEYCACPLGCERELWMLVEAGAVTSRHWRYCRHPWKDCGELRIMRWVLVVVARTVKIHFKYFLSLYTALE